ncbi:MAG: Smr/MutS family protein [Patescibacteria group bacterium]
MSKSTLHLDLHPIAQRGTAIDEALAELFADAARTRAKRAEIIPGKGSGQLKKRVLKYLAQPHIKQQYKRYEIDSKNHGRLFIHFR